ncbi:MAG: SCO family protein [Pseudomonadota bacterium]
MPTTKTYAIAASVVVAGSLGVGAWMALNPSSPLAECGGGVATGGASIGGPFKLVSETGTPVTDAEIIDRPTLMYFGYTFCPDVCPVDAANMAAATDVLAERGYDVRTAFVTIDPARDTPEVMADFTDNLHPDMIGLTGTDEQIADAAGAYRVFYQKAPGDDPDFYLMDHSAFIYLMHPENGFLNVFRHGVTPDEIAENTACFIDTLG